MQWVILGTAQWGLDYGTTNSVGRLTDDGIRLVLDAARTGGISCLDTAPAYGDAEERVGHWAEGFTVQTKVAAAGSDEAGIRASVETSLARLGRSSVDVLLVHDWPSLPELARSQVAALLEELRTDGIAGSVGVSGYTELDIASALDAFSTVDVIQVPVSVLDQRLEGSAEVHALRSGGGRLQARSVLLQGAAVAPPEHPLFGAHPDIVRLRETGRPLELCLGYLTTRPWVDEVVLAVTSPQELTQVLAALATAPPATDWPSLASADPWLLDPRRWTEPARED